VAGERATTEAAEAAAVVEAAAVAGGSVAARAEAWGAGGGSGAAGGAGELVSHPLVPTGHVPYRDSKLTRILQPALAGRCRL